MEIRKIDKLGRVTIPSGMRKKLGIEEGSEVGLELEDGVITIIKRDNKVRCQITGRLSDDMIVVGDGITLSKEGAVMLVNEIKKKYDYFL